MYVIKKFLRFKYIFVDLEVTGVSRSGRVRKKSSKLMDFESPDDIERNFNKKTPIARKIDVQEPKKQRFEEVYAKEEHDSFEGLEGSDSEYGSEYEQPANTTESSIDESADTEESEYDDVENSSAGFRRLDPDSAKKKLIIKDGRIIKGDKFKGKEPLKIIGGKMNKLPTKQKTTLHTKTSPTIGFNLNVSSYETVSVSPPSPRGKDTGGYKVNGIKPIDVAAHLKLLGESLTIIGLRLKEHEGQIAVSGSLSVLLDSLLCALGPLLCLTQQIPELQENCCDPDQLINTLDNVAFIMPGL